MNTENGEVVEQIEEPVVPVEAGGDEENDLEERARRLGWKPRDEYRGPPGRWRDAKTFIEHGETELPIVRERLRTLERRAHETEAALTAKLSETENKLKEQSEVLVELRDMSRRAEETAYTRARREIEAEMQAAVETADLPKYHAARQQLDQMEQDRATSRPTPSHQTQVHTPTQPTNAAPTPQNGQIDPAISEWTQENPWFDRDPVLKAYAIDADADLMRKYPGMPTRDRLDEVTKKVVTKFPEKFGNTRRSAAAPVATPSSAAPRKKGKSVDDLPPEARQALARFKAQIPGYKDEDYLKMYFQGEE